MGFFGFAVFGIWPLVFVLVGALCIRQIVIATTRPRKSSAAPACERCHYHVGGLSTFRCPECGTDLRATGIITPAMELRRRGGLWAALMAWTMLMLGVSIFVLGLVASMMWSPMMATNSASANWTNTLTPLSGAYTSITLETRMNGSVAPLDLTLKLKDGSSHKVTIHHAAGGLTITDGSGATTTTAGTLTAADLEPWFKSAGLDPTLQAQKGELVELANIIGMAAVNPSVLFSLTPVSFTATVPFPSNSAAAGSSGFDTVPVLLMAFVGLLLIYGFGIYFIISRRRRLNRMAKKMEEDALAAGLASAGIQPEGSSA